MKLFETAFQDKFNYYERYFNTETQKSETESIDNHFEYFIPYSTGEFKLITDQTLNVTRLEGSSKQARGNIGVTSPIYKHIRDKYWRPGDYNLSPRIIYLDIETRALGAPDPKNAPEQIILIQMLDTKTNQVIVLGLRPWEPEPDYEQEYPVKYIKCKDEIDLLSTFLKVFKVLNPVIIYAWNGEGFDFPYLYNRLKKLGLDPNKLSNYGQCKLDFIEDMRTHRTHYKLTAPGHYYLDSIEVYKKYIFAPRPSYSLDTIAKIEVRSNKVEHEEFPTFDSFYTGDKYTINEEPYKERIREQIRQGYIKQSKLKPGTEEYNKNHEDIIKNIHFQFVYYGVMDVILLRKIDEKLNLSKILVNVAKTMGVLYNDVLGTVKPWSQYISNMAFFENLAMPKMEDHEGDQYEGAFVREPVKGRHKWVMNFDVNSMYPQFSISGFGMSPETLVTKAKMPADLRELVLQYFTDKTDQEILDIPQEVWDKVTPLLKKYNFSLTANGNCFRRDVDGIIPRLTNKIYDGRKIDKKTEARYEERGILIEQILAKRGITDF